MQPAKGGADRRPLVGGAAEAVSNQVAIRLSTRYRSAWRKAASATVSTQRLVPRRHGANCIRPAGRLRTFGLGRRRRLPTPTHAPCRHPRQSGRTPRCALGRSRSGYGATSGELVRTPVAVALQPRCQRQRHDACPGARHSRRGRPASTRTTRWFGWPGNSRDCHTGTVPTRRRTRFRSMVLARWHGCWRSG
jgi:hypothetical protein